MSLLKKLFSILPPRLQWFIRDKRREYLGRSLVARWEKTGKPVPVPNKVKELILAEYQKEFGCETMVETGTYLGEMVSAQRKRFRRIISVELAEKFYEAAKKRFAGVPGVELRLGDSGKVLPEIVPTLTGPSLFWLDGHWSGGETAKGEKNCPVYEELSAIFAGPGRGHVFLIDDARMFTGQDDYPTIPELEKYIRNKDGGYHFVVKNDIIRATPRPFGNPEL